MRTSLKVGGGWAIFIFSLGLILHLQLSGEEICDGKTERVTSKQIFLNSNYKVWEHLFVIKSSGRNLHFRFLTDSPNLKRKNRLIWYSPMRSSYPDENDLKYLGRFISNVDIGGVSDGENIDSEGMGLPLNVSNYGKFFNLCIKDNYVRVALLGRSRGAASLISYVRQENSPSFDLFLGIYPVVDWESYPTLKVLKEIKNYDESFLRFYNPGTIINITKFRDKIDNIFILHGSNDKVVPFEKHSLKLATFSNVEIQLLTGLGHDFSEGYFLNETLIQKLDNYFYN